MGEKRLSDPAEDDPLVLEEKLDADRLGFKHKVTLFVLYCGEDASHCVKHEAARMTPLLWWRAHGVPSVMQVIAQASNGACNLPVSPY